MNSVQWYISQFPESMFLCPLQYQKAYAEAIIRGKDIAQRSNVLICTIMRNIDRVLPYTIARIEATRALFKHAYVYIYENDSTDATKSLLSNIVPRTDYIVLSENVNPPSFNNLKSIERRTILANARNKYLDFARAFCNHHLIDYVIILDADLLGGWSYHGLLNSLGQSEMWDIIGSNSLYYIEKDDEWYKLFYDSWAFRPLGHPTELDDSEANVFIFNRGEPMISVNSCFGGFGLYRPHFLYEDIDYTNEDCDHPTLHNALIAKGYRIYINPSQITLYNKSIYTI